MGKKNKQKDDTAGTPRKKAYLEAASAVSAESAKRNLRIKHLSNLLAKAESGMDGSDEQSTLKVRVELADALLEMGNAMRAATVLSKHGLHVQGTADPYLARHRLAPLLLRLGREHEASALLQRWTPSDQSAVMLASHLLYSLSAWMGGASSRTCAETLSAAAGANEALVWLLAAPKTRQVLCKLVVMPAALVEELGEQRAQMRARAELTADAASPSTSSLVSVSARSSRPASGPAPGGLEEALLLITGPLDGWASKTASKGHAQPWGGGADAGGASGADAAGAGGAAGTAEGPDDEEDSACMEPQVDHPYP